MQQRTCNSISELIGVLRWAVELGRLDIYTEVALLSQHLALPRVGHLEAAYHIFAYLMKHEESRIIFDSTDQEPADPMYHKPDWSAFYENLEEELPPSEDAGALGESGNYACVCRCQPRWECSDSSIPYGHFNVYSKLTHPMVKPKTEHRGDIDLWK